MPLFQPIDCASVLDHSCVLAVGCGSQTLPFNLFGYLPHPNYQYFVYADDGTKISFEAVSTNNSLLQVPYSLILNNKTIILSVSTGGTFLPIFDSKYFLRVKFIKA